MSHFPVRINGREFMVDPSRWVRRTLQTIRAQGDSALEFGEQTLTPEDLWRRSQDDWRYGAGKHWEDKDPVDSERRAMFASSRGVDPWTRGELKLLKDTERIQERTGDVRLVVAGDRLYSWAEGSVAVSYTADGVSWTSLTDLPQGVRSAASDGSNLYLAVRDGAGSAGGVYRVGPSASVATKINDVIPDLVAWVAGRLMVARGFNLYNITDTSVTTAPPALTAAAVNEDFRWTCFGETGGFILVGGVSGDRSAIYAVTINDDATELGAPTMAAPLPAGELVQAITGYVGVVLIATNLGLRVGTGNAASVQYGGLLEVPDVRCLEPHGSHVWFGWTNYDALHTGLGRVDLSTFLPESSLVPAHASDLMVRAQGVVSSVGTFKGKRVFSVFNLGIYWEAEDYVTSGVMRSGLITYGLPERKVFEYLQVRCEELPVDTEIGWRVFVNGALVALGSIEGGFGTDPEGVIGGAVGDYAEVELELFGGVNTPVVHRRTLRAQPIAARGEQFFVPIVLRPKITGADRRTRSYNVVAEFRWLKSLEIAGEPVRLTAFGQTYRAYIVAIEHGPELDFADGHGGLQGIVTVVLQSRADQLEAPGYFGHDALGTQIVGLDTLGV